MHPPLNNYQSLKKGYTFGVKTFYSNFHLGEDLIVSVGTPIYAPVSGDLKYSYGNQGGNTIYLSGIDGKLYRFLHLSTWKDLKKCKEGDVIAFSGNSGSISKGSGHLHWDISKNGKLELNNLDNFIDPEIIINELLKSMTIARNQKNGEFAYIQAGKRRKITQERAGLAMITIWTKSLIAKDEYKSLTDEEFNEIPAGKDF